MRDLTEVITEMLVALTNSQGRKVPEALMDLLEVRDLAREGQVACRTLRPAPGDQTETWRKLRIGMSVLELEVHAFLAAQPQSTPDEDQQLQNKIGATVSNLAEMLPEIAALQAGEPGGSPAKVN